MSEHDEISPLQVDARGFGPPVLVLHGGGVRGR